MYENHQVVAVIPARDEAQSIAASSTISNALSNTNGTRVFDRILVCDNGSGDNTAEIASRRGAVVVHQAQAGYGIACQTALSLIENTDIVVFIDADASLQIDESRGLLETTVQGADLAIGVRHPTLQQAHSMSFCQRFGNILASILIRPDLAGQG